MCYPFWRTIKEKHPSAVDASDLSPIRTMSLFRSVSDLSYRMQAGVMEEEPAPIIQIGQSIVSLWVSGQLSDGKRMAGSVSKSRITQYQ